MLDIRPIPKVGEKHWNQSTDLTIKFFPRRKKESLSKNKIFPGGEFLIEIFSQSLLRNRERSSNDFQMVRVVRIVPEKSDKFLKVQPEKEEQHKN